MGLIRRLIYMSANSNDEDLSADVTFRFKFAGVVNFLLLIYSLVSGVHALLIENQVMAMCNIVLSLIFFAYFFMQYVSRDNIIVLALDRVAIFVHFIIAYACGAMLGFSGVMLVVYPFIAIILHGRRVGVILSFIQLAICITYTLLCKFDVISIEFNYSAIELFVFFVVQFVAIWIFYIAMHWMSSLIYDRIMEVAQLSEALQIKSELVANLTDKMRAQLNNIAVLADKLSHERVSQKQMDTIMTLKASSRVLIDSIDSVATASKLNIKPVEKEEISFNVCTLITNIMVLYGSKAGVKGNLHSMRVSSDVPQTIVGNSLLTRQVFLSILDALDNKFALHNSPMRIGVNIADTMSDHIILDFSIKLDRHIQLDHREIFSMEQKLINHLHLDSVQRLIVSADGEFSVEQTEDDSILIEFTLPYKTETGDSHLMADGIDDINFAKVVTDIGMKDVRVLVVDADEAFCGSFQAMMEGSVAGVSFASDTRSALKKFENSRFDIVFVNQDDSSISIANIEKEIRDMSAGYGPEIPVCRITNAQDSEEEGVLCKPLRAKDVERVIRKALNIKYETHNNQL